MRQSRNIAKAVDLLPNDYRWQARPQLGDNWDNGNLCVLRSNVCGLRQRVADFGQMLFHRANSGVWIFGVDGVKHGGVL